MESLLILHSTNGTINNAGTILGSIDNGSNSTISIFTNKGTINGDINNNGTLTDFTNSGSISGTFTNEGHIVKFVNESTGSINNFTNNNTISFFENNGIITSFNGNNGTIYGVINSKTITNSFENVATSLWNKENALITGNVALKGDYKDCSNSGSTICQTSDLINEGTITGNVTNDTGKEINLVRNTGTIGGSIANSGNINTFEVSGTIAQGILNDTDASISSITINKGANLGNSGITNNSNIGTLKVYESVTYTGNGSDRITQALEVAKDKTLTIGNNGTLSFNSKNGNVNNLGTIAGNLSNVKDSTITSFTNSGTINGNINNEGTITSRYGVSSRLRKSTHTGLDISAVTGTDIKVVADGTVISAGYRGSYGYLVKVDHGNGVETWYAHTSKMYVKKGDTVKAGDVIAGVGSTGNSTGPHLHLEIRVNGETVDPQDYLYNE